jgi:hypothetical protein
VKDLDLTDGRRVDDMDWRFGVQSIRYPGFGIELGIQMVDDLGSAMN